MALRVGIDIPRPSFEVGGADDPRNAPMFQERNRGLLARQDLSGAAGDAQWDTRMGGAETDFVHPWSNVGHKTDALQRLRSLGISYSNDALRAAEIEAENNRAQDENLRQWARDAMEGRRYADEAVDRGLARQDLNNWRDTQAQNMSGILSEREQFHATQADQRDLNRSAQEKEHALNREQRYMDHEANSRKAVADTAMKIMQQAQAAGNADMTYEDAVKQAKTLHGYAPDFDFTTIRTSGLQTTAPEDTSISTNPNNIGPNGEALDMGSGEAENMGNTAPGLTNGQEVMRTAGGLASSLSNRVNSMNAVGATGLDAMKTPGRKATAWWNATDTPSVPVEQSQQPAKQVYEPSPQAVNWANANSDNPNARAFLAANGQPIPNAPVRPSRETNARGLYWPTIGGTAPTSEQQSEYDQIAVDNHRAAIAYAQAHPEDPYSQAVLRHWGLA